MTALRRPFGIVIVFLLFAASCGSKGPDLATTVKDIPGAESVSPSDIGVSATDASGDKVTGTWRINGEPATVADAIAAKEKPDERTDDAGGDVFLLYKSGTLWLSPNETGSNVVLYADNDKAYNRHSGVLLASNRWGSRINTYRSSGSSSSNSGNGFRGGGSSSGK
ncbi:MAG: DUF4247 domain-containing protein [Acidimicrobiales bacterium]